MFESCHLHPALSVLFVLDEVEGAVLVDEAVAAVRGPVRAPLLLQLEGGAPVVPRVRLVLLQEKRSGTYEV